MNTYDVTFSFELFPPRNAESARRLPETVKELAAVNPAYFSVTYGAGGSNQQGTYETSIDIINQTGIAVAPHLTCIGSTRAGVNAILQRYQRSGIKRIVALRGDLPATAISSEAPGEFRYAEELVRFIRNHYGTQFRIEVAGYPEIHPQAPDPDTDFEHFKCKVRAGADGVITQYFYNSGSYFDFVNRCQRAQLSVPVVPGIMPITNYQQLARFSSACGAEVPRWIRLRLEHYQNDRAALKSFGLEVVTRLCDELLAAGAPGLHFYTLNQAEPTLKLWRNLRLPTTSL